MEYFYILREFFISVLVLNPLINIVYISIDQYSLHLNGK